MFGGPSGLVCAGLWQPQPGAETGGWHCTIACQVAPSGPVAAGKATLRHPKGNLCGHSHSAQARPHSPSLLELPQKLHQERPPTPVTWGQSLATSALWYLTGVKSGLFVPSGHLDIFGASAHKVSPTTHQLSSHPNSNLLISHHQQSIPGVGLRKGRTSLIRIVCTFLFFFLSRNTLCTPPSEAFTFPQWLARAVRWPSASDSWLGSRSSLRPSPLFRRLTLMTAKNMAPLLVS